jgi:glycosyltransferase involved in cell wall biosynthesis
MRILQITANFAPRGASPAVRTVNLVKALVNSGNSLEVLTYTEEALTLFSPYDENLYQKVPKQVRIYRISPGILRRRLLAIKKFGGNVTDIKKLGSKSWLQSILVPDPHVDAIPSFVKEGKKIISNTMPDLLITHAYPFSFHIIGYFLKLKFPNLMWIADYGDPWSSAPIKELYRPKWRELLDMRIERHLLARADFVTVTTKPTKDLYKTLFPYVSKKISVVPMGYDVNDFRSVERKERAIEDQGKIWIVHTGRLYSQARNPLPFLRAIEELQLKNSEKIKKVVINLVGEVEPSLRKIFETSPCRQMFNFVPWVPQEESLSWMKSADYLLLFGNKGGIQVPGKIYQYLGAQIPIFLIYESKADPTLSVVNETNATVVENTVPKIVTALEEIMNGKIRHTVDVSVLNGEFSWPEIARRFIKIVEKLAGHSVEEFSDASIYKRTCKDNQTEI